MSQATNAAIATLQRTIEAHELLIDNIMGEHRYCYESLKLPCSDETFLCIWGGYMSTKNILLGLGHTPLEATEEMLNKIAKLLYHL